MDISLLLGNLRVLAFTWMPPSTQWWSTQWYNAPCDSAQKSPEERQEELTPVTRPPNCPAPNPVKHPWDVPELADP